MVALRIVQSRAELECVAQLGTTSTNDEGEIYIRILKLRTFRVPMPLEAQPHPSLDTARPVQLVMPEQYPKLWVNSSWACKTNARCRPGTREQRLIGCQIVEMMTTVSTLKRIRNKNYQTDKQTKLRQKRKAKEQPTPPTIIYLL